MASEKHTDELSNRYHRLRREAIKREITSIVGPEPTRTDELVDELDDVSRHRARICADELVEEGVIDCERMHSHVPREYYDRQHGGAAADD